MKEINWKEFVSADGNVLRSTFKGCDLEMDADLTWMHVYQNDQLVFLEIKGRTLVYFNDRGCDLTENWTEKEWEFLEKSIPLKKGEPHYAYTDLGYGVELKCFQSGRTVFLQGDDAENLLDEVENLDQESTDMVLGEYFA